MAEDMQACECCEKEFPIQTMTMTDDGCWICEGCDANHREHFAKCDHAWEPETNSFGEPSQYCPKCTTIVRNEDMPLLFTKSL